MKNFKDLEVWFVTGSQHLYGAEALAQVAVNSQKIAASLDAESTIPFKIVFKPVMTTGDEIRGLCREANNAEACIGLILWMHTFSPAKMWIAGLKSLAKPFLHLHTQFNKALPYATIDMDFMNLNQAAHGDREFGHITARMGLARKVVVGFWQDPETISEIAAWTRAAAGWHESQHLKVARFGDNMRDVSVTDGDKVSAEATLGYSVNGYGIGDLAARMNQFSDAEVATLVAQYREDYSIAKEHDRADSIAVAARIELGLEAFLTEGGFGAFTDTFQDLYGLDQLPGIASQRLMAKGFGFAGEGDWKTAALVRTMKVMADRSQGRYVSFMEDYTYHLHPGRPKSLVLGAHMLEICPSIAAEQTEGGGSSRSASAARPTRYASSSPRLMDPPSLHRWSIWATASASSSTRSTSFSPSSRCPTCPLPAPSGTRSPASRSQQPRGSTPAARTTPASARRSPPSISPTSPRSPASSSSSSTARRSCASSARCCAGKSRPTPAADACAPSPGAWIRRSVQARSVGTPRHFP